MGLATVIMLAGCAKSVDETEEFNKPAFYWYKKIAKSISADNMDKADAFFISLKSEHVRSPLMPTAIMMLAHAHIKDESYLLANYYLDEYNKRYSANDNRDYIDFLKIKAGFLGISNAYKDQKLMLDSIKKSKTYISRYPGSVYAPLVNTILIKLSMNKIHTIINEEKLNAKMLLQIHDELIFEVNTEEAEALGTRFRETMESIMELNIPLKASLNIGDKWSELK